VFFARSRHHNTHVQWRRAEEKLCRGDGVGPENLHHRGRVTQEGAVDSRRNRGRTPLIMLMCRLVLFKCTLLFICIFFHWLDAMLPTPLTPHLSRPEFQSVYEPAEDTFLLLDALQDEAPLIRSRRPRLCVEIGYVVLPAPNLCTLAHHGWRVLTPGRVPDASLPSQPTCWVLHLRVRLSRVLLFFAQSNAFWRETDS
jgi:hypothetical protein